jgi:hypothetical protein
MHQNTSRLQGLSQVTTAQTLRQAFIGRMHPSSADVFLYIVSREQLSMQQQCITSQSFVKSQLQKKCSTRIMSAARSFVNSQLHKKCSTRITKQA